MLPNTPPATNQAWGLWLLTNILGISGFMLVNLFNNSFHLDFWGALVIVLLVGGFALVGSVLVVPVATPIFRNLLAIPERKQRIIASAGAVSTIFLTTASLLFVLTSTLAAIALYAGGWAYWPAALLAAAWVYRRPLFRPNVP